MGRPGGSEPARSLKLEMSFTGERPYSQGEARENALVHRILQLGVPELERLHRLRALVSEMMNVARYCCTHRTPTGVAR